MAFHPADAPRLVNLQAGTMFDGVSSSLTAAPSVLVADGRIAAIHGQGEPHPAGVQVIDVPGLTLMPGPIDAHVHLAFDASDDPVGQLVGMGDDVLRERMADAAGRALVAGSDAGVSPAKPHDVLGFATEDLAAAGMSPAEVLWAMTCRAAQACGLGHRKGRIAVGFDADILTLDGNPLEDLAALRRLRAVYADGLPVSPAPDVPASVAVH